MTTQYEIGVIGAGNAARDRSFRRRFEPKLQLGVAVDLEVLDSNVVLPGLELDHRFIRRGGVPRPVAEHFLLIDEMIFYITSINKGFIERCVLAPVSKNIDIERCVVFQESLCLE